MAPSPSGLPSAITFPCDLLALAYSNEGQALLQGFHFFNVQNVAAMPDKVPLFGFRITNKEQLQSVLKSRGLDT